MASRWDGQSTEALFAELRQTDDPRLRAYLIEKHAGLVRHVAREYASAGETFDDLISVGHLGLINAVDRFDPQRGTRFATFAVPTIKGEIRRHFRDRGWGIRVPRRVQELVHRVKRKHDELSQLRGRSPSYRELATALGVGEEEVVEAFEASQQYDLLSTDASLYDDDGETQLSSHEREGALDPALELIGDRDEIQAALDKLPPRERVIIKLRYSQDMSQTEIAKRLGISQMHVSRLQHRALGHLRRTMGGPR